MWMQVLCLKLLQGTALAVCLVLVRVLLFFRRCWQARQQYLNSAVPGPPLSSILLGHIPEIIGAKGAWRFADWSNTWGHLYKIQYFDEFGLVLTDPEAIARVTRKTGPGPYMPKPRRLYKMLERTTNPPLPNILTADDSDPYWKAVRQGIAPCFSTSNLKKVLPLVVDLTKRVCDRMSQCELVDVTDGAKRITSDIMGDMLFGEDLGGTRWKPNDYLDVFHPVQHATAALLNNPFYLWQLWSAEVRHARRCFAVHDRIMAEKVQKLRDTPPADYTIAAHLLKVIDPSTGKPLHNNRLKQEVSTILAAGFETSSHAISWCLALLAAHPGVQEEVYKELLGAGLAIGGGRGGAARDFEVPDLSRLPLLSAVIKEGLRLCPPVPTGGARHIVSDGAELCGYQVPKDTVVIIPMLAISLATFNYGPDTLDFRPGRWLSLSAKPAGAAPSKLTATNAVAGQLQNTGHLVEDAEAEELSDCGAPVNAMMVGANLDLSPECKASTAMPTAATAEARGPPDPLTFLSGPRDCVGQNLAKLELHVVLATLLARFKFSPGPELQEELQLAAATGRPVISALHALAGMLITLQPLAGKLELRVQPRS